MHTNDVTMANFYESIEIRNNTRLQQRCRVKNRALCEQIVFITFFLSERRLTTVESHVYDITPL